MSGRGPVRICRWCRQSRHHAARGLCEACYQRSRRRGITAKAKLQRLERDYAAFWRLNGYAHTGVLASSA